MKKNGYSDKIDMGGTIMRNQWKRNAVVATVLLFVCAAVYLN